MFLYILINGVNSLLIFSYYKYGFQKSISLYGIKVVIIIVTLTTNNNNNNNNNNYLKVYCEGAIFNEP